MSDERPIPGAIRDWLLEYYTPAEAQQFWTLPNPLLRERRPCDCPYHAYPVDAHRS